jgi:hypothetical protein
MYDYKDKIAKSYGKYETPESSTTSENDFEKSFMKYITPEEENDYYAKLGSEFTKLKFGEIDNSEIDEYKESFKKSFS